MDFRVLGLSPEPFRAYFGLPDAALAAHGIERHVAETMPGYPDRIALADAPQGSTVLLLNWEHQPAATPYRSRHAIFVSEAAHARYDRVNEVPSVLRLRMLSLRAFDAAGSMVDADLVDGPALEPLIEQYLSNPKTAYLHAHFAKRGCYAARIERA